MKTEHASHLHQNGTPLTASKGRRSRGSTSNTFYSSVLPGPGTPVPVRFGRLIGEMESILRMPIWVIIQNQCPHCGGGLDIGMELYKAFQLSLNTLSEGEPVAILLESPGGDAHYAYRIARLLQRRTKNNFVAIIPQYAKSAATLMALGATRLIIGEHAELGPLDVQEDDLDKERSGSALDAVQSLEHLNAFGLKAYDQAMALMIRRTGKRTDFLMPHALTYVSNFLSPLLQKIDTVDYTHKSRELKVAEEYAVRLMRGAGYSREASNEIAQKLVVSYPTHGFVIDRDEVGSRDGNGGHDDSPAQTAIGLGLKTLTLDGKFKRLEKIMIDLVPFLDGVDGPPEVIGFIRRAQHEKTIKPSARRTKVRQNGNTRSR